MIRAILTSGSMRSLRHKPDRSCATKPGHTACHRHDIGQRLSISPEQLKMLWIANRRLLQNRERLRMLAAGAERACVIDRRGGVARIGVEPASPRFALA